jgi:hypothetical protein
MSDNFFALLDDGTVKRIALIQNIESSIRNVFMTYGPTLIAEKIEVEFDGNYKLKRMKYYMSFMKIPPELLDVPNNPIGLPILNLKMIGSKLFLV